MSFQDTSKWILTYMDQMWSTYEATIRILQMGAMLREISPENFQPSSASGHVILVTKYYLRREDRVAK